MEVFVSSYLKNDGSDSTKAIQQAIDYASSVGGGKVILDGNRVFRSGIIIFRDNIELHIEKGSKLMASDNLDAFNIDGNSNGDIRVINQPTWENCDYSGKPTKYFLYALNCNNISITGDGIIDGNEEIFYGNITKWHIDGYFYPRVPLIFFENCKNVKIQNITLQRSAFWTTHLIGCQDVGIDSIKILNNLRLANCDGIDPDHCKNVVIKNCYIEAADDCIVFKTTQDAKHYGPCENILVSNCTLISTSAAIKFGTESVSDFRNIKIHDCKILKSNRGISFQLRDEGNIENIEFKNIDIQTRMFSPIHWWGKAEPISITAVKRKSNSVVGNIKNVSFENITMDCENGIFVHGELSKNISDISFENITLVINKKTDWENNIHDLRPSEDYGILKMPLNVMYIKNAENISVKNFKYKIDETLSKEVKKSIEYIDSSNINLEL